MERHTELEIANYQDAWAKLYLHLARAVVRDFGIEGEVRLREGIRNFGIDRGRAQRAEHKAAGLKLNMENLFGKGDLPGDPRFRRNKIRLTPQERLSETLVCPLAVMWRDMDGLRLGRIYCEEFHHAKFGAYAPKSQTNLSQTLTQEGDQFCRFSIYLRPGNMTEEERREAFAEYDPDFKPENVKALHELTVRQGFTMLCVKIVYHIGHVLLETWGEKGAACLSGAIREFGADFADMLRQRAAALHQPFDRAFAQANAPLDFSPADHGHTVWALYADKRPEKLFVAALYPAFGIAPE